MPSSHYQSYVSSLGRHAAYDPRRLLAPRAAMLLCPYFQSHLLHLIGLSYLYFLCTAVRPMVNYPHSRVVFYFDFPPPRTWLAHGCTISSSSGIPSARVLFPSFVLVWVKHNAASSHSTDSGSCQIVWISMESHLCLSRESPFGVENEPQY